MCESYLCEKIKITGICVKKRAEHLQIFLKFIQSMISNLHRENQDRFHSEIT